MGRFPYQLVEGRSAFWLWLQGYGGSGHGRTSTFFGRTWGILELYWDNGKESGNYHSIIGLY